MMWTDRRLIETAMVAVFLLSGRGAGAQSDPYASGFYSRGTDAALNLDTPTGEEDLFYLPVRNGAILPRVTLTATRDDNVFLTSRDEKASTGMDLIPGVLLIHGRPNHNHLYVDLGLVLPLYESEDAVEDDPGILAAVGGRATTGKSDLSGRAAYRRSEEADTLVGSRIVKDDYVVSGGAEHRLSSKTSVGLVGVLEIHDYEENTYVDYDRTYGAGRFYRRLTGKSDGYVQVGVGRDDLDAEGDAGDADFHDVALGIRGRPSAKTTAAGRVGYQWRQYDDDALDEVEDWIAALGGTYAPFGLTTFTGDVTADIRPAINATGSSTVERRLTLGAHRRLFSERLRGAASVFVGDVDYHGGQGRPARISDASDLVYDGREDENWGYSLGLDWWTRQQLSVGLSYAYIEQDGVANGRPVDQERTSYTSGIWVLRLSWNY